MSTPPPSAGRQQPVAHLPISSDTELVLHLVDGAERGRQIDIRMARRATLGAEADAGVVGTHQPTSAGFRLPAGLAPALAEALTKLARRAAEHALWRAPSGGAA